MTSSFMSTGETPSVDYQKHLGEGALQGPGDLHPQKKARLNRMQVIAKDVIYQFPQLDNSGYRAFLVTTNISKSKRRIFIFCSISWLTHQCP